MFRCCRPTGSALLFALLLFALLSGSINYQNNLGFLLTFLLAGALFTGLAHTVRNRHALQPHIGDARPVFAGQTARFPIRFDNPARRARHAIEVVAGEHLLLTDLPADAQAEIELGLPMPRRGLHGSGPVEIASSYPLGLLRCRLPLEAQARVVVYPHPVAPPERDEVDPARPRSDGEGDEFRGFRRYRSGDSLRRVHWKGLARGLPLMSREHEQPREAQAVEWIDWESLPEADTELRLSWLCQRVLDAHGANRRYGLRLPGRRVEPASGDDHRHRCLTELATF